MLQVQIVSVSVDVQQSTPIFQPNNVQLILINQIMLFVFSWPVLLHSNLMLKGKHAQCQLVKYMYMNWPDSVDYKIL